MGKTDSDINVMLKQDREEAKRLKELDKIDKFIKKRSANKIVKNYKQYSEKVKMGKPPASLIDEHTPVKEKIAHIEAKTSSKKSASISEDTPGKLFVGGGGEEIREGSKTPGRSTSASGRSYTPLKGLRELLDTAPVPLSDSDYETKINEIEEFKSKAKNKSTNLYYNNSYKINQMLKNDTDITDYVEKLNNTIKAAGLSYIITQNTNVGRLKNIFEELILNYGTRKLAQFKTKKASGGKLEETLAFLETSKNTPPSKKKEGGK
jgi:predicted RND superfamily exporter protein